MTELDERLRRMEKQMDRLEVTNGKLERLEDSVRTQFKSVELNIQDMKTRMDSHFLSINGTVAALKESEIRRDEREKVTIEMVAKVQVGQRWWTVTAIGAAAALVTILDKDDNPCSDGNARRPAEGGQPYLRQLDVVLNQGQPLLQICMPMRVLHMRLQITAPCGAAVHRVRSLDAYTSHIT